MKPTSVWFLVKHSLGLVSTLFQKQHKIEDLKPLTPIPFSNVPARVL